MAAPYSIGKRLEERVTEQTPPLGGGKTTATTAAAAAQTGPSNQVRSSTQAQLPGVTDGTALTVAGSPTLLANLLRQQRGLTGPNRGGRISRSADDFYGQALSVLAQLSPTMDGETINSILAQVGQAIGSGQGLGGMMHASGQQAMQGFDPLSVGGEQAALRMMGINSALGYGGGAYQMNQSKLADETLTDDFQNYEARGGSDFFADNPIDKTDYWKRLVAMAGQR